MKTTQTFMIRLILLGVVIPIILSIVVYAGFATNYTLGIFSKQGFDLQNSQGVYRYRILGKVALTTTYDLIRRYQLPTVDVPSSLSILDPDAEKQFYSAYLYLNTLFLCLTTVVLFIILSEKSSNFDFLLVDLPLLSLCFVMTITQFAVVPYDMLSSFLLALSICIIFRNNNQIWQAALLVLIVVLATLVRETAFFIIIFYIAVNYNALIPSSIKRFRLNHEQVTLLLIMAGFVSTYFGLRFGLGYDLSIVNSFSESTRLVNNIKSIYAMFGIVFLLSLVILFLTTSFVTKEMILFLKLTSPYVLFILLAADPWEIRLWTPIILVLVLMKVRESQINLSHAFVK